MIMINTERLYMLDMRGKKKKSTWEKNAAGDWLPRSLEGANRHYSQMGFSLTEQCRMKQRKVYPTEAALKRALLSMLPRRLRDMELTMYQDNMVYGEKDNYTAELMHVTGLCALVAVVKKKHGWVLKFGSDTIRSITREIIEEEELRDAHFALRSKLKEQRVERTERLIQQTELFKPWVEKYVKPN